MNRTRWLLLLCGVPLLLVLGVLASAGLNGGGDAPSPPPATSTIPPPSQFAPDSAERTDVGRGRQGAAIFRPKTPGGPADGAVVVFLHGWAGVDSALYGRWIDHLVRRGTTVIYPIYQEAPYTDTATPLPDMLVALRLAFEEVDASRLVVAGHSAGGALAADYAASADAAGLPPPDAVFSVYPGRAIGDVRAQLKAVDGGNIPAGTRMVVLGGADDTLVGTRWARQIARDARRADVTLRIVRDEAVDDHTAPTRDSREARRTFWQPLDRLVDATR